MKISEKKNKKTKQTGFFKNKGSDKNEEFNN